MGFSVSGSTAILFLAAIMSIGVLYTAAYNGFEHVEAATIEQQEDTLEQQNTAINISNSSYDSSANEVSVTIENEGSTTLSVNATDVLINGTYKSSFVSRTISGSDGTVAAGSGGTDLWQPGEELTVTVSTQRTPPMQVKIVTGPGVATTEVVT